MVKKNITIALIFLILVITNSVQAQIGYHDAPYARLEADAGTLVNATATSKSYLQNLLQSEASDQVCVNMTGAGASVSWTLTTAGDGLVVRYSVPDGESGVLDVYADNALVGSLNLTTYYSWEYLWSNGNPNNVNIVNQNPKMRFDEVRIKLASVIPVGGILRLERQSGNIHLDFAEIELVPAAVASVGGDAVYTGNGSDLQDFIDANGGGTIFVSEGVYNVNRELYFGANNTVLKGAGSWYSQIHFTNTEAGKGGLRANASDISFSGLYLTTAKNSRTDSYKAINGVFTSGSVITDIWGEHFECGVWIGQYNSGGPAVANGFLMTYCRFRNNYADGINLCKGTLNSIVEHCSFRNNGDDDMAIWSANGQSCQDNTYRYCTSENCWRAAGVAIYGGANNTAHHLLIKDNLEVGIKVNNTFPGAGFSDNGMHEFHDITLIGCGTFNDLYNNPVGAIDLYCTNSAGTRVKNVKFANIEIVDSKNDAIYIRKNTNGEGFYNLIFENISVDGTGKEFPGNNAKGLSWGRGYGVLFVGSPKGNAAYCGMTYTNRGGNAASNVNNAQIGTLTWLNAGCGTEITSPVAGQSFGECDNSITITANASATNGTVDFVEFYVDDVKIGQDNTAPYSFDWTGFNLGQHKIYVRSVHSAPTSYIFSTSLDVNIVYYKGLISTATAPTIDGVADALWTGYSKANIFKPAVGNVNGKDDLSATFQVCYDAANFYLFVEVTDDDLSNDGGLNWENDALEVFMDIGNDKLGSYGANDYNFNFVYNDATVYETKSNAIGGVTFAQVTKSDGYSMEISFPWSTIGGSAIAANELMGFDVHIDDDDAGGTRDAKISWSDCNDAAWNNPGVLGTLQESGCTVTAAPEGIENLTASLSGTNVQLNWSTIYKTNDDYFKIQRDITGLGNFLDVGTVYPSGIFGVMSNKGFTHVGVPNGNLIYRIKLVDVNGCELYSDIIDVGLINGISNGSAQANEIRFYPNPFLHEGNLSLPVGNGGDYEVNILDCNGKKIWSETLENNSTNHMGENLSPGIYIVEVFDGAFKQTLKLIKF